MNGLEASLYQLAHVFLYPVIGLILLSLAFAFYAFGSFLVEAMQRRRAGYRSALTHYHARSGAGADTLELWVMKRLEWLRIVSRTAPMLGLVATMIPMGPALLALTRNDAATVGENLVVAFSSVIIALLAASITFFVMTIRRRWLLEELVRIEGVDLGGQH